jgi:agmatine deiminase
MDPLARFIAMLDPETLHQANVREDVPASLGYRMPAEWEKHEATWLSWPHNLETWPTQLSLVEAAYIEIIKALAPGERVNLLIRNEEEEDRVWRLLSSGGVETTRVSFYLIPTEDVWIRDYGPVFLVKREEYRPQLTFVHWRFNAWGGKYADLEKDNGVSQKMHPFLQVPFFEPGMVLEGGSIDGNGKGTILVTEQCLLNPNRNPELGKEKIEECLKAYLGVNHVIWLGQGIAGDDTDGHVDDIVRFVAPRTVVCAVEENAADENHAPLQDNRERLEAACDQDGAKLEVIPLAMPPKVNEGASRLPASYANFYIGNAAVLVPTFGDPQDQKALTVLEGLFPKRKVVGIPCRELVYGLGAIHCITRDQPQAGS